MSYVPIFFLLADQISPDPHKGMSKYTLISDIIINDLGNTQMNMPDHQGTYKISLKNTTVHQSQSHIPQCIIFWQTWWRHQMEIFSALLAICVGNSPVPGEFPTQRPVTRSFDVFFDLHPNKRLSLVIYTCVFLYWILLFSPCRSELESNYAKSLSKLSSKLTKAATGCLG